MDLYKQTAEGKQIAEGKQTADQLKFHNFSCPTILYCINKAIFASIHKFLGKEAKYHPLTRSACRRSLVKMQFNLNLPFWSLNGKHEVKSPFLTMTVYLQGCLLPMNQLPNSIPCSLSFIMTRKIQHLISLIIRIPVLTFIARDVRVKQGVELL